MDRKYDVIVIGAGVAGASVARELCKYELSVGVLEKEADVCFGASKGTHGLVHCGIPAKGAPLRSRAEHEGNVHMKALCEMLDVPYRTIGKLLVGFNDEEAATLANIEKATRENGVTQLELIRDKGRLKELEPNLSDDITAALHTPTTGAVDPWALVIALMENAKQNGAELHVDTAVQGIETPQNEDFVVNTSAGTFRSKWIVNAAGAGCAKIARMVGDESFSLKGLRFQRIIMDKKCGGMVRHLVRDLRNGGAADFVFPTVDGNVMVGSTVEPVPDMTDAKTTREGLFDWVIPQYRRMIPAIQVENSIRPFAAVLPIAGPDFHIAPAPNRPHFVNQMLGVSGFTASAVMAEHLIRDVMAPAGLMLAERRDFNPERKGIPRFVELSDEERADLIAADPAYGRIVCRCESVTEGEIVEAIRRGATTRDGIKFRTRAGMGRCQSNFCRHKVLEILRRELHLPPEKLTRRGPGSEELA